MRTPLTLLLITLSLLPGCSSDSPPHVSEPRTVTHRSDGITETATPAAPGLASERSTARGGRMMIQERVPSTAAEIGQPTTLTDTPPASPRRNDAAIIARPTQDGEVWLVEHPTGRILYAARLRQGDTLLVNLTRNELSLNARPLSHVQIDGAKQYKIYHLPG